MLLFGAGQADLTPPEPLPLGGYTERQGALFEPGGDPIFARARVVGDVVLVSLELLTVPESLVAAVRAKTGEAKLLMVATHTHCAPDSQMLNDRMTFQIPGIATFRRRWLNWMSDRIAEAVRQARANQQREIVSFDVRQVSLPYARARRPLGVPDNWATEVDVHFADGQSEPLFRTFAAHATLYGSEERKLRGDWPGALMSRHGGLAFPGAIGDVSPVPESPNNFADAIARGLQRAPATVMASSSIEFSSEPIRLDTPSPHPEFAKANGITPALAQAVVTKFAPPEAHLSIIKFGSVMIIGVPGEPSGELGRTIRLMGARKGIHVAVVSHANGWIGYILSKADYERGGYEAQLSMNGPSTGSRIIEAARRVLSQN